MGGRAGQDSGVRVDRAKVRAALPGYVLKDEIGRGTFGAVLAATDRLGRDVAVKVVTQDDGTAEDANAEALILHRLRHPHIVEVFDFVPHDDIALIVMELLAPGNLRSRMQEPDVTPEWACAVVLAVAGALELAHAQKVLHRDVKPANVLFDAAGRPKLGDFGIAKAFTTDTSATSTLAGTPLYMAPEQFLARRLRRTADVYALGGVTYHVLTGEPPSGDRPREYEHLRQFHVEVAPRPPTGVPPALAAVVLRSLEKDPARRQQSAEQFAVELASAAARDLGPDWLARAGIDLVLAPEVTSAARATAPGEASGAVPPPAPTGPVVPAAPPGPVAAPLRDVPLGSSGSLVAERGQPRSAPLAEPAAVPAPRVLAVSEHAPTLQAPPGPTRPQADGAGPGMVLNLARDSGYRRTARRTQILMLVALVSLLAALAALALLL